MSGLCGLLMRRGFPDSTHSAFLALADTLGCIPERRVTSGRAGVAAGAVHGRASVCAHEGLLAAVEGRIIWSDTALSELAKAQGDACALAQGYRQHGVEVLQAIRGPFSLAVTDEARDTVLLAVDRMGVNPMCFASAGDDLYFATRADVLARHPQLRRGVDEQGIYNYLFCHMVPAPGTIFRDVFKLLPGQYCLWTAGRMTRGFYWRMPYDEPQPRDIPALAAQFRGLLDAGVARAADTYETGAFLSGGTDSSTVAGVFRRLRNAPVDTYSIGFDAPGFDETEYARIAARHFDTRPHEYYVTPEDVFAAVPAIARAYDEPFGNASAVPTYYCAKLARDNGMRVLLAGDGGDELFGGNERYAKQSVFEAYGRIPAPLRAGLIEPALMRSPVGRMPAVRKLRRYVEQARVPLPDRLESYNFMLQSDPDTFFEAAFLQRIDTQAPLANAREVYERAGSSAQLNRMLHLDLKQTLADNDLRKVNRMCELAGVAVHYPMMDEDLAEFSARLAPSLKLKGRQLRWFFKDSLRDFLPVEIITKQKHGFGLPFGLWLQQHQPLQELAYDSLLSFAARGYLKRDYLDWLVTQHRSGHASYYGVMVWVIMMLEQWLTAHAL